MTWFTGLAVYVIIWWLVFFMVLPIGAGQKISDADIAEGQFPGAPAKPRLLMKVGLCTVIAGVFYAMFHVAWETGLIAIVPETPS
jgi:predicted secreted protein